MTRDDDEHEHKHEHEHDEEKVLFLLGAVIREFAHG